MLKKINVLTDSLPYELPPSLQFALLQFACHIHNSHPNSQFPFASPQIIVHGTHNGYAAFPHGIPLPFGTIVRSLEAPGIEPQTGIVVGITANSVGSHEIYYPSYNKQPAATILSRAATQLTAITSYPSSWNLSPPDHSPSPLPLP